MRGAWQLSPLDLALGGPFGEDLSIGPLAPAADRAPPRAAFEACVAEALRRPPCVVSFSGGRDSSAVLAVAASVAAREGLPPPVPVTLRFAHVPSSHEDAWQEALVARLRLPEWVRLDLTTEVDLLGPSARAVIARHGVLWPANAHFHEPVAALARGGAVLTGFGGDEMMSPGWVWDRAGWVLTGALRPSRRDLAHAAASLAPAGVRRLALARRRRARERPPPAPWLTPAAAAAGAHLERLDEVEEPVRFDAAVLRSWWPSRYRSTVVESLGLVAGGHGAAAAHPFTDAGFLRALAAHRGRAAARSRTLAMRELFADVLPEEVVARRGKATFDGAFWGPEARAFAAGWSGAGADPRWVDVEALRRTWAGGAPDARSYPLLQAAWAASGA